jgi:hypothetical protein
MNSTITASEIAEKVREYLKREAPDFGVQFRIDVLDDGIYQEDDEYWYVPVLPEKQPKRTSDYYEMLAEIETCLLETDDLQVTLVPTLPD